MSSWSRSSCPITSNGNLVEQYLQQLVTVDLPPDSDISQYRRERPDAQRTVIRDGKRVNGIIAVQANMAAGLASDAVSNAAESIDELPSVKVTGQLHAASTSSLT